MTKLKQAKGLKSSPQGQSLLSFSEYFDGDGHEQLEVTTIEDEFLFKFFWIFWGIWPSILCERNFYWFEITMGLKIIKSKPILSQIQHKFLKKRINFFIEIQSNDYKEKEIQIAQIAIRKVGLSLTSNP